MKITNSQIKSLIKVYNMIIFSDDIPINDISNMETIKRFQKVLNDLLKQKIQENNDYNDYFNSYFYATKKGDDK